MIGFSPAVFPPGMVFGRPDRRWGKTRPQGFGAWSVIKPPPGVSVSAPGAPVPLTCPTPGPGGAAPSQSTPVPSVPWVRYQDAGMQETYARLYDVLRQPAVLGVKVVPEEQADAMARQIIDAIIALPQSHELRFRAACALKDIAVNPISVTAVVLFILGMAGFGTWVYYRTKK